MFYKLERHEFETHLEVSPSVGVTHNAVVVHTTHGVDTTDTIRNDLAQVESRDVLQGVEGCVTSQTTLVSRVVGKHNLILPNGHIVAEVSREFQIVVATLEDVGRAIGIDLGPDTACGVSLVLTIVEHNARFQLDVRATTSLLGGNQACLLVELVERTCTDTSVSEVLVTYNIIFAVRTNKFVACNVLHLVPPIRRTRSPAEFVGIDVTLEVDQHTQHIATDIVERSASIAVAVEVHIYGRHTTIVTEEGIHRAIEVGCCCGEAHFGDEVLRVIEEVKFNLTACAPRQIDVEFVHITRIGRTVAIVENLAQRAQLKTCIAIVAHRGDRSKVPTRFYQILFVFGSLLSFISRSVEGGAKKCRHQQCVYLFHSGKSIKVLTVIQP